MSAVDFVWSWFLKSQGKAYVAAFLGSIVAMSAAPHIAPILAMLGITVLAADIGQVIEITSKSTVISIDNAVFGAGALALAVTVPNALRVLFAKHPKAQIPLVSKDMNVSIKNVL